MSKPQAMSAGQISLEMVVVFNRSPITKTNFSWNLSRAYRKYKNCVNIQMARVAI